jgi:asparagine synthase (glutamine-hydrolysing)
MCGIVALVRAPSTPLSAGVVGAMTRAVAHRGPDGEGTAFYARSGGTHRLDPAGESDPWAVAFGHRRLSIIDLSAAGKQPMAYRGRFHITYNGEIYNYLELRRELADAGHDFRSDSDTEVILAAYAAWGEGCFARFRGMWGLALLDAERGRLVLSRDRLGIKPLYLSRAGGVLAVVSEIKQLLELRGALAPHAGALATYLVSGYEDATRSFFADVDPVPAGTTVVVDVDRLHAAPPAPYWQPERVRPHIRDRREAAAVLGDVLADSVRLHLRSDVPVGCALSGGLDSSSIAACAAAERRAAGAAPLDTFTVDFPGTAIDERAYAAAVAAHVGAVPHHIEPTPTQFLADLDRFVWIHDEPVGTLAQYSAYALARLTRGAGVPVTLNGQGGDEVLSGYWQSYFAALRSWAGARRFAALARELAGAALPRGNAEALRQIPIMARRYLLRRRPPPGIVTGAAAGEVKALLSRALAPDATERRVFEIRAMYLPRLLKWDDRNFMAFSVEGRYPFLDHVLIERALEIDPVALYQGGWVKEPLRRAMADRLPAGIVRRRSKLGFEVPQREWVRGPLRPTLEALVRGDSPLWAHADRRAATDVVTRVFSSAGVHEELGYLALRLLFADRWLRLFADAAAVRPVAA